MNLNATLFGMAIWFILLIWFAKAKIWPPLMAAVDARNKKIADGLAEAEKGKMALAEGEKQKAVMLKDARDAAGEIKSANEKQALKLIDEAKAQAKVEAGRIIAAAHAQIAQEQQK
ncbi:MAG: F0F1 ATP synthase subunit B, partial [Betaproteobacteria bacterium]|nr:F0F1 ATP synthase subunit B [Betaproteobacteria bacterium]